MANNFEFIIYVDIVAFFIFSNKKNSLVDLPAVKTKKANQLMAF